MIQKAEGSLAQFGHEESIPKDESLEGGREVIQMKKGGWGFARGW